MKQYKYSAEELYSHLKTELLEIAKKRSLEIPKNATMSLIVDTILEGQEEVIGS